MSKADYVRRQPQTRAHTCHWPGCERQVKPAVWGCLEHWRRLPTRLQRALWAAYRPGQEEDGRPSKEYVTVAQEIQDWIHKQRSPYPEVRELL